MIEWQRIVSVLLGCLISIPVFFIGNLLRFFKVGRELFHVKTRDVPPDVCWILRMENTSTWMVSMESRSTTLSLVTSPSLYCCLFMVGPSSGLLGDIRLSTSGR